MEYCFLSSIVISLGATIYLSENCRDSVAKDTYTAKSDPSSHALKASTPMTGRGQSSRIATVTFDLSAAMNSVNRHVIKPESASSYLASLTLICTNLLFQVLPMRLKRLFRKARGQHG